MTNEKENIEFFKGDKENPFKVPDGYFDKSRARIMEMVAEEKPELLKKKIYLKSRLIWLSGIAASLLIGFVLLQNLLVNPAIENRIAQEVDWFIDYSGPDLDMGDLAEFMVDEGISLESNTSDDIYEERSILLDLTDYDELSIIEEWMEIEN